MIWREFKFYIPHRSQQIDFLRQQLLPLLDGLYGQVTAYSYNFYYPNEARLELRVEIMEKTLEWFRQRVAEFGVPFSEGDYEASDEVKRAYELGSRGATLAWRSIREGKITEEQIKDPYFRHLALHGLFNSMGFSIGDEIQSYCFGLLWWVDQGFIKEDIWDILREVSEAANNLSKNE